MGQGQMPHLGRGLHSLAAQGPLRDRVDGCHDLPWMN